MPCRQSAHCNRRYFLVQGGLASLGVLGTAPAAFGRARLGANPFTLGVASGDPLMRASCS